MNKLLSGSTMLALIVGISAPFAADAGTTVIIREERHYHGRHRSPPPPRHRRDRHHDHHRSGDDFFLGALFGALSATTLLDYANVDYFLDLAQDRADDAAVYLALGEKTHALDAFIDGFRKKDVNASDEEIAQSLLCQIEALLQ